MKLVLLTGIISLGLSGVAAAQSVPFQGACRADAQKLCGTELKSRDRAKVQACLAANSAKVSPNCAENLKAAEAAKSAQTTK